MSIYGKTVTLRLREVVAWWPAVDGPVLVVIARDPQRKHRVAYLLSTDLTMTARAVVEAFARRWTIEQLFSVAKNQMGFDSAEVRTERSVLRHAALAMAMVTWVEVWARRRGGKLSAGSFSTKLSAVRRETLTQTIFASGPRGQGSGRIAAAMAELFTIATRAA